MSDSIERSVEERLQSLEATVESLDRTLRGLVGSLAKGENAPLEHSVPAATTAQPAPQSSPPSRPFPKTPPGPPSPIESLRARGLQFWISRVGIVLLLVSVALLFQYAVDEGWLTPTIRVAFGVALGVVLVLIGLRVQRPQPWFSQVMFGGASATWYITGFAAFQLLHLVGFPVAFAFMVLVTVYTFWAAVRQDAPVLAALGSFGGLGTPFFLYTESGTVAGLMAYTCLVLVGTSGIYLFRGWRSLLWTTAIGAWSVVGLGFDTSTYSSRVALQLGMITIWLLYWLVPVAREVLAERNPERWPRPSHDFSKRRGILSEEWLHHGHVAVLVLAITLTALFASRALWTPAADTTWGLVAAAGVLLYAAGAWRLSNLGGVVVVASAHEVTAAVLAASAIALLCGEHLQIVLWAVEAATLALLAKRFGLRALEATGHILFAIIALRLAQRLLEEPLPYVAVRNPRALADAAIIAVSLVATRWVEANTRRWYWLAAHGAVLAWVWRELTGLTAGSGIVTATWGVYGLILLLTLRRARTVGLATMLLAVAKLVMFDLSQVEPIWRILLFMGFGAVFLVIAYYFRSLWDGEDEGESGKA